MYIEKWKDVAFGSDYGGDFQLFLEEIPKDILTLSDIYERCDIKKYLDQPDLLNLQPDNNVYLHNTDFNQFIHYEDAIIALSAIIAESQINGSTDLTKAYGSKTLIFDISKYELIPLLNAMTNIYNNPEKFILFELLDKNEKAETTSVIKEIIEQTRKIIDNT